MFQSHQGCSVTLSNLDQDSDPCVLFCSLDAVGRVCVTWPHEISMENISHKKNQGAVIRRNDDESMT